MRTAFSGFQRLRCRAAGGQPVDDRELGFGILADIGMTHRVAIDRRVIERRQIDRRDHVGAKHASARILQRDGLDFGDRRDTLGDQPLDSLDRKQRTAERKTNRRSVGPSGAPHPRHDAIEPRGSRDQNVGHGPRYRRATPPARSPRLCRRSRSRRYFGLRDAAAACRRPSDKLPASDAPAS